MQLETIKGRNKNNEILVRPYKKQLKPKDPKRL